jgi:uncharacterized protein (TIGR02680 family)
MNRLGFVNFWVYDVEEFPFKDGKLLLRGANGSGKSITTQSFIPYILDADRSPERLDPFGSRDRKMDYYLLGNPENGKEESTAYLYLEFQKPRSRQYRTIGIGLHAKRNNAKMTMWGFCILDGRRVGYDIMLYKEAGSENIPLDPKNLRKILGENNIYVDKVSDYKAMVAKHIFGIDSERISDFDQLTNILIKTRSSKLSSKENLKPEQLYDILNESLQTLTDDDLRPMSEAMSKIEDSHRNIEDAQNALKDVQAISAEYDRYNKYMLRKKAEAYLRANTESSSADAEMRSIEDKIRESEEKLLSAEKDKHNSEIRLEDLKREKDSLNYDDIKQKLEDKNCAEQQLKAEQENEQSKKSDISNKKEICGRKRRNLNEQNTHAKDIGHEINKKLSGLEEYGEFRPPMHDHYVTGIRTNERYYEYSSQCNQEINDYRDKLNNALNLIKDRDRIREHFEKMSKFYDDAKNKLADAEESCKTAQKLFDEQKDKIIEGYYIAAKNNEEYSIDEIMLSKLEKLISNYEGQGTAAGLSSIIHEHKSYLSEKLNKEILECKAKVKSAEKEYEDTENELSKLKNASEPVPDRTNIRADARRILNEKGICARPFYECIDFKDNVDEAQRALLEAELSDMGVLDALVVPRSLHDKVMEEISELSDCIISVDYGNNLDLENEFFVVTAEDELKDETCKILQYAFSGKETSVKIGTDGSYCNGILKGHSVSEYSARFIGAESRRKYREKQINDLTFIRDELLCKYNDVCHELDDLQRRAEVLKREYENLPDTSDINQALDILIHEEISTESAKKQLSDAESAYTKVKKEYDDKQAETNAYCREFTYRKTEEDYADAIKETGNYLNDLQEILSTLRNKMDCMMEIERLNDDIASLEYDIDSADRELQTIQLSIHRYNEEIRLYDEFLNRPENIDASGRMQQISREIEQLSKTIDTCKADISSFGKEKELRTEQLDKIKEKLTGLIEKENELAKYFKEELELGFVISDSTLTLKQCAERADKMVMDDDKEKDIVSIHNRLNGEYRKHCDTLAASYNPTLEEYFDDAGSDNIRKRIKITLVLNNKQIPPAEFEQSLSSMIEEDKLLVKYDEEQMFKEILLNTISKKLYYRIDSSRKWVESMAELMKSINTSMGLSFSLSWKPKNDRGDNELTFNELNSVLNKDKDLIDPEDYEKLSAHFRSKIESQQRIAEEQGKEVNYSDLVRNVLDFRNWFEFRLLCRESDSDRFKELTMSRFHTFSGGERALCLYIPLFAAVAAQYKKAGEQAPLILALDEAFAGVDDSNISEMFGLLEKLGFGYIVNSQSLWGCYDTVPGLEIAELFHEKDSNFITVILYEWNGVKKTVVE